MTELEEAQIQTELDACIALEEHYSRTLAAISQWKIKLQGLLVEKRKNSIKEQLDKK